MSIQPRFYAPDARAGSTVLLPSDEAQHAIRVLRLGAGDAIRVFDGRGQEFDAIIDAADRSRVRVSLVRSRSAVPEPLVRLTLAMAVLKGDKMDDVVRDAAMLGVAAIQPMVTDRTEVSMAALDRGRRTERWKRIVVSSIKQCGRAVVPHVASPVSFDAMLENVRSLEAPAQAFMFVEPAAAAAAVSVTEYAEAPHEATLLIGPEGGWSPAEVERGVVCRQVTLGARTIRADAMPIVAVAALFATWREF